MYHDTDFWELFVRIYFILYIVLVVLLMFNMFLAIVMSTYDIVASELAKKARTEVTGDRCVRVCRPLFPLY
jgi:hypothetical protein